jgi:hypothetical protein
MTETPFSVMTGSKLESCTPILPLLRSFLRKLQRIHKPYKNNSTNFLWIPKHDGLLRNETAENGSN